MSDKQRRAVTLDPENDEFLAEQHNASALVNELVTEYRKGEDKTTVALQLQIRQKRREMQEAKERAERLEGDLEELERLKSEFSDVEAAKLEDAKEALEGATLEVTNDAVKHWAQECELTPQQLIDRVE